MELPKQHVKEKITPKIDSKALQKLTTENLKCVLKQG